MKIAYFDCFAGAGGDMIVAAMIDAGLDGKFLRKELGGLKLQGVDVEIIETKRCGLRAVSFVPKFKSQKQHRGLGDIVGIIEESGISEQAKDTAISIFRKLAAAEAGVHGKEVSEIHLHEVGAVDSIVDIVGAAICIDYFST